MSNIKADNTETEEVVDNEALVNQFTYENNDGVEEDTSEAETDDTDETETDDADETESDETEADDADDADEADEGDTDDEDESDDDKKDDKKDNKKPKKAKTVEQRIKELTYRRHEAERIAAENKQREDALAQENRILREKLGLTDDKQEGKPETKGGPDPKDFKYGELDDAYIEAREKHLRESILAEVQAQNEQARQAEAAARKEQESRALLDKRIEDGVRKYDDFEDVVFGDALKGIKQPSDEASDLIIKSEHSADLLYHMAKNPDEVKAVVEKSPIEQALYIGRLEAKYSSEKDAKNPETKKAKKVTSATKPITRARGTDGKFSTTDDTDDFAAFEKKHG